MAREDCSPTHPERLLRPPHQPRYGCENGHPPPGDCSEEKKFGWLVNSLWPLTSEWRATLFPSWCPSGPQIFYPSVLRYFYDFPIIRALRVHSTWVQPRFSSLRRSLTRSLDLVEEFFDHEDHPRWCWLWRYSKRRSDPLTRSSGGVLAQQSLTPRSILPPNPPSSSSSSVQLHPNDIICAFVLSFQMQQLFHSFSRDKNI